MTKTKRCTKCGVEHTGTLDELNKYFSWNNKSKKILNSLCKECNRKRCRDFRNANKDRYNEISKKWSNNNKDYFKNRNLLRKNLIKVINNNFDDLNTEEIKEIENLLKEGINNINNFMEDKK